MGSQGGFIGRIGNVIHYKMDGKLYTRSAPRKYKQTKATKAKSREFGMASTIGRVIRENLQSVIFETDDRKMQIRLVGKIYKWLQVARHQPASAETQPTFVFFQFSTGNPVLSARWLVELKVSRPADGQIQIAIPSFIPKSAFRAPAKASSVMCRIASVVIDVEKKKEIGTAQNEISYTLDQQKVAAQKIIQELPMPVGSLLITALCLEFCTTHMHRKVPTNNKLYKPCQIIYAVHN
jgi:hypothetical protein